MKQIGARQEAGRIGGIGPCGRPLCCASWMSNFVSVATSAARYQEVSLNPQKLAGQCAKLKCCINFEVDTYVEVSKSLPKRDVVLETKDKSYYHFKTDILKREITYSTEKGAPTDLVTISPDRVVEVMALNKQGIKPERLQDSDTEVNVERSAYGDLIGQDSISRFDNAKKKKKKKNRKPQPQQPVKEKAPQAARDRKPKQGGGEGRRDERRDDHREDRRDDRRRKGGGKMRDGRNGHGGKGDPGMQPTGLKEFRPRNPEARAKNQQD